jgi:hypothetical protein
MPAPAQDERQIFSFSNHLPSIFSGLQRMLRRVLALHMVDREMYFMSACFYTLRNAMKYFNKIEGKK